MMSGKKRKIQTISHTLPLYPTHVKHLKYSNTPVVFPQIVKVESTNAGESQNSKLEKVLVQVNKMQEKINRLETQLKFQSKTLEYLERNSKKLEVRQDNNKEMLDLVKDVECKLNLPNSVSLSNQSISTPEFSYIS